RHIELVSGLKINRDSLRVTLDWLLARGWIDRNPGYGHSLRPEYILTPAGMALGRPAMEVVEAIEALGVEDAALRKWALAIVHLTAGSPMRFAGLRAALPAITPRALTQALKVLQTAGLIDRAVEDGHPPQVTYRATRRGRILAKRLEGLVAPPPAPSPGAPSA
ncbi:MAG TPA: helix-turn-helix domain-containing protein, partial [bacterium]|nr:helix-turn-helix domain-containing protein [bacterium]